MSVEDISALMAFMDLLAPSWIWGASPPGGQGEIVMRCNLVSLVMKDVASGYSVA